MPMSTVRPPLTRLTTSPLTGSLVVGGLLQRVPHLVAQRLFVADQVAAFRLLALDHHVDRIAGLELGLPGVVQHLLDGDQTLGLQPDVDHDVLIRQLDDGAGHHHLFGGQVLGGSVSAACSRSKFASAAAKSAAS